MSVRLTRYVTRVHKLFGLVIGFQILIWTISGTYFTLFPIEMIHGDHLRQEAGRKVITPQEGMLDVPELLTKLDQPVQKLELRNLLGTPVWQVTYENGEISLIDAISGENRAIDEPDEILQIIGQNTKGLDLNALDIRLITASTPREYAGPLPVHQIIHKPGGERFYVPVNTGDLKSVRTNEWRIFDVLWRFHIMDITGADRFDSWWLRIFAGSALVFVLSGFFLLGQRLMRGKLFS